MKISGFTIIKNAILNDYPIVEAITSILPVVDEMVVLVGDSNDETRDLIASIGSDKIRIFDSVWDPNLRTGGKVLAVETDKALALIDPTSTWAFYIQADEVVHENFLPAIKEACEKYKDDTKVEGLLFRYLHFYGTYDYVGDSRRWYKNEIRIIRNDKSIHAYRDAQGFRRGSTKLKVKRIDAYVYHYGWVKSPAQMKKKINNTLRFWVDDDGEWERYVQSDDFFNFNEFDQITKFGGTHPWVMRKRIDTKNWNIELDVRKRHLSLKNRFLIWLEKTTGIALFTFKNYRIVR